MKTITEISLLKRMLSLLINVDTVCMKDSPKISRIGRGGEMITRLSSNGASILLCNIVT
jgi:hypothetical protein